MYKHTGVVSFADRRLCVFLYLKMDSSLVCRGQCGRGGGAAQRQLLRHAVASQSTCLWHISEHSCEYFVRAHLGILYSLVSGGSKCSRQVANLVVLFDDRGLFEWTLDGTLDKFENNVHRSIPLERFPLQNIPF